MSILIKQLVLSQPQYTPAGHGLYVLCCHNRGEFRNLLDGQRWSPHYGGWHTLTYQEVRDDDVTALLDLIEEERGNNSDVQAFLVYARNRLQIAITTQKQ